MHFLRFSPTNSQKTSRIPTTLVSVPRVQFGLELSPSLKPVVVDSNQFASLSLPEFIYTKPNTQQLMVIDRKVWHTVTNEYTH